MKKLPMATARYMDDEEFAVLLAIKRGEYKSLADLEAKEDAGLMADFAMLSYSGYCGWKIDEAGDRHIVLTKAGEDALNVE